MTTKRDDRTDLDPDRRRPRPTPRFWPLDIDLALVVCDLCSCPIPDTDRAKEIHTDFHKNPPTPPPGDHGRGGVEGATKDRAGAGLPPGATTPPEDAAIPPAGRPSGGTNLLTRKRARPDEIPGKYPSGRADPDEAEQAMFDATIAAQGGGS